MGWKIEDLSWVQNNEDFYRKRLRPNVVRIVPFTSKDVEELLASENKLAIAGLAQKFKCYNKVPIKVFYGKLSPDTALKGLNLKSKWNTGATAGRTGQALLNVGTGNKQQDKSNVLNAVINTAKSNNRIWVKALGWAGDLGVNYTAQADRMSGINLTTVGAYTLKEYGGFELLIPSVKCRYYMPADVDFAIKSLTDLMRMVYPNVLGEAETESMLGELFAWGTDISSGFRAAITGYVRTSHPTPVLLQIGQWLDIAPVVLTDVNIVPSDGMYTHTIKKGSNDFNITMPQVLNINLQFSMYMKMPPAVQDYKWFNLFGNDDMFGED